MKKNLTILYLCLAVAFYCCNGNKQGEGKQTTTDTTHRDMRPQVDFFGLDPKEMGTVKRETIQEELFSKAVPNKPHGKPQPPITQPPSTIPCIYLVFNGTTVRNTSWNYNGDIVLENSGMTAAEMQTTYDSMVSKYSKWIVNVTTDSLVYKAAPANKRIQVVYTKTYSFYGNGAGGVSFIGSFTWADNTPCFVFTSLLNYNTKYIFEAGAHECAHTIGLYHQSVYDSIPSYPGNKISEYSYGGCGSPVGCGKGYIIGVSYYQPMSIFSKGYNSNKQWQDDEAVISQTLQKR